MNYKDAGVDIEAGKKFVDFVKGWVEPTLRPEVLGGFGGFNGMIKVPSGYKSPVLVAGSDGVGTKLNLAKIDGYGSSKKDLIRWPQLAGKVSDEGPKSVGHYNVGIDLVAMCVNDVITCGAEPLYFLDYIATGKVDEDVLRPVIEGISFGCYTSGCALLGGETAEMPKMYDGNSYDLAGFCTGIVEEEDIIDGSTIEPGDKVIGIPSNGLHSNGFSLINKLMFMWDRRDGTNKYKDFFDLHPLNELLNPTIIYAPLVKSLLQQKLPIKGMANITGGGLPENLPRCLPEGLKVDVDYDSWKRPEVFKNIAKYGDVSEEEMRNIFNLGIGYCVVVPDDEDVINDVGISVLRDLNQSGVSCGILDSWVIGTVESA